MELEIAYLEMRSDEIWDLLQDPTLPPLDREELAQEMDRMIQRLIELEDDDGATLESCDSESIGPDEYDREGVIIEAHFDLSNEI